MNNTSEQTHLDRRHESSSAGVRPSSAAPVEQNHLRLSATVRPISDSSLHQRCGIAAVSIDTYLESGEMVLFDGGGRGRTRSDRRAFVSPLQASLFDGSH